MKRREGSQLTQKEEKQHAKHKLAKSFDILQSL